MRHAVLWVLITAGCGVAGGGGDAETADDGGGASTDSASKGDGGEEELALALSYSVSGLVVTVVNGTGDYRLGMVGQLGAELWTGEDCCNGATLDDGTHVQWCHPLRDGSTLLTCVDRPEDITSTDQTALCDVPATWFIEDEDGNRWVWGQDPDYYESADCTDW